MEVRTTLWYGTGGEPVGGFHPVRRGGTCLPCAVSVLFSASAVYADTPARSRVGTLEYTEGAVLLNGQTLPAEKSGSQVLSRGGMLKTEDGHAEMLLTPGVYLRLGHNASARLVNESLTDTRVRLEQGSAMLEVDNLHKDNSITVEVGESSVRVSKEGLYRFETNPPAVQVLKGQVEAIQGSLRRKAGTHHQVALDAELRTGRFKEDKNDELGRRSRLRSEYEAEANVAAAQYVYDMGWGWRYADWFWNPWFGTWTWLPARAWYLNPYGFTYWSPLVVYNAFPARYYGVRHVSFVPAEGASSPSGLNLERTAAARSMVAQGWSPREAGESRGRAETMRAPSMGRMSAPRGRGR